MKTNSSAKKSSKPPLSISHKAAAEFSDLLHHLPDAVIITDITFNITGWNDAAEKLHGLPGARGKNLFELIRIDLLNSSNEAIKKEIVNKGNWEGEVIYHRHNGEKFIFKTTATAILD